jgi:hypothetical protein
VRLDILHGRGLADRADNAGRDSSDGEFDRRQRVGFGVRESSRVRLGAATPASWSAIDGKAPQVLNGAVLGDLCFDVEERVLWKRQSMARLRTGRGLPKSLRPRTAEHLRDLPISDCRSIAGKITTPVSDETNRRWLAAANVSVDRRRYPMPGSRHRYFRSRRCRPDIWRHRSATQRTRR